MISEKYRGDDRQHPVCREDEKRGDEQDEHASHEGEGQQEQNRVARHRHAEADVKDLQA